MGSPGTYLNENQKEETLHDLIMNGLTTDGEHHKQWYIEQIAKKLNIEVPSEEFYIKGIAP